MHPTAEQQRDSEKSAKVIAEKYEVLVRTAIKQVERSEQMRVKLDHGYAPLRIRWHDMQDDHIIYGDAWQYWRITRMEAGGRIGVNVEVALEFDADQTPKGFYCVRHADHQISEYDKNRTLHTRLFQRSSQCNEATFLFALEYSPSQMSSD